MNPLSDHILKSKGTPIKVNAMEQEQKHTCRTELTLHCCLGEMYVFHEGYKMRLQLASWMYHCASLLFNWAEVITNPEGQPWHFIAKLKRTNNTVHEWQRKISLPSSIQISARKAALRWENKSTLILLRKAKNNLTTIGIQDPSYSIPFPHSCSQLSVRRGLSKFSMSYFYPPHLDQFLPVFLHLWHSSKQPVDTQNNASYCLNMRNRTNGVFAFSFRCCFLPIWFLN